MQKMVSQCPCCGGKIHIAALQCDSCGMELRNCFEGSVFDKLSTEQHTFLLEFLRQRGNLKNVQSEMDISYPTAKKRLDDLLVALELATEERIAVEELDMSNLSVDRSSKKASEIIKAKLLDHGGYVTVYTARGLPCEIWADADGRSFVCDKLPIKPPYEYRTFDVIVELMLEQDGHARKGNGRNYKLGEPNCDHTTVVGAVAIDRGFKNGESVFDPVFVLAAVLEWAGIVHNERGELVLTQQYRSMV